MWLTYVENNVGPHEQSNDKPNSKKSRNGGPWEAQSEVEYHRYITMLTWDAVESDLESDIVSLFQIEHNFTSAGIMIEVLHVEPLRGERRLNVVAQDLNSLLNMPSW